MNPGLDSTKVKPVQLNERRPELKTYEHVESWDHMDPEFKFSLNFNKDGFVISKPHFATFTNI